MARIQIDWVKTLEGFDARNPQAGIEAARARIRAAGITKKPAEKMQKSHGVLGAQASEAHTHHALGAPKSPQWEVAVSESHEPEGAENASTSSEEEQSTGGSGTVPSIAIPGLRPLQHLPRPEAIRKAVGEKYDVTDVELCGDRRFKKYSFPRKVCYLLFLVGWGISQPEAGRHMGGRDHTTVLSGLKSIRRVLKVNAQLRGEISQLCQSIEARRPGTLNRERLLAEGIVF